MPKFKHSDPKTLGLVFRSIELCASQLAACISEALAFVYILNFANASGRCGF
jgi:hypothetical protein